MSARMAPRQMTQDRSLPAGATNNPDHEKFTRFNMWDRPAPIEQLGRTPGLTQVSLRGNVLGPGMIRRMWRQTVNLIGAQAPYSWSSMTPSPGHPSVSPAAVGVTRALRYMTRCISPRSGEDYTRFSGLHTRIRPKVYSKPVTLGAGNTRSRPTVRNRVTSFGSRVATLNEPIQGAENDQ